MPLTRYEKALGLILWGVIFLLWFIMLTQCITIQQIQGSNNDLDNSSKDSTNYISSDYEKNKEKAPR